MDETFLQTPESVIYRRVADELIVIQLDSGQMFYFNPSTQSVLDFFKEPRKLSQFLDSAAIEKDPEAEHIKKFARFLLQNGILKEEKTGPDLGEIKLEYSRPQFLRMDEKTLDEIAFLCP